MARTIIQSPDVDNAAFLPPAFTNPGIKRVGLWRSRARLLMFSHPRWGGGGARRYRRLL